MQIRCLCHHRLPVLAAPCQAKGYVSKGGDTSNTLLLQALSLLFLVGFPSLFAAGIFSAYVG